MNVAPRIWDIREFLSKHGTGKYRFYVMDLPDGARVEITISPTGRSCQVWIDGERVHKT